MPVLRWKLVLACFLAGAVSVTAFAPFDLYPIAFIAPAVLILCWCHLNPRQSFWVGLAYGYGLYGFGVSWVYVSLSTYGGMPFWMGAISVLGFAGLLALFVAATGYISVRFFPKQRLLAMPFIWGIFEWMKSWVLTGFPWLDIAYTQTNSWLFSLAPIGGVYLISLAVVVVAAALAMMASQRIWRLPLTIIASVLIVSLLAGQLNWSTPSGPAIQVGVVQGNVPINEKWQAGYRDGVIEKFAQLSRKLHAENPADLIIWPETALPLYMQQTNDQFWRSVTPEGSSILTGILDSPGIGGEAADEAVYNAAVLTCGAQRQLYRKRHLVPFGEYLPLRFLFNWVLDYLQLPMSDSAAWQGQQRLECGENIKIGLSICYEDAFAAEYRTYVGDATLLVNISEDAWFGDSLAPHQRLQMAQMRARELSRPLVRSANSGPSVVIDERGRILAVTPQFEVQTINYKVQPQTGDTPFKRFGNWVIWFSGLVLVLMLNVTYRNKFKSLKNKVN